MTFFSGLHYCYGRWVIHNAVKFSSYELEDKSSISVSGDYKISCSGFMNNSMNDLKIGAKDEFILSCSTILKDSSSYTTPLIVELDYGYITYVTKSITVKNIPGT